MYATQLRALYKVAAEVGEDVNNPEGGLTLETADNDIIEVVVDVTNGHNRGFDIDPDLLTERQRERVLECFYEAAHRTKQGN
jgi:hypothetical protein